MDWATANSYNYMKTPRINIYTLQLTLKKEGIGTKKEGIGTDYVPSYGTVKDYS